MKNFPEYSLMFLAQPDTPTHASTKKPHSGLWRNTERARRSAAVRGESTSANTPTANQFAAQTCVCVCVCVSHSQHTTMNRTPDTECVDYDTVQWWDTWNVISMVVLLSLDVLVIVGNILVIAAVYSSQKLRSVTNFFIVSLAVADLLVGVAVLPFSATWEVFKVSRTVSGASHLRQRRL